MVHLNGTILFENRPRIISSACAVGKKEGEGPLREDFDRIIYDSYVGCQTFEQGESELMRIAAGMALQKGGLQASDVDLAFCGDLLNQCVASSFAMRDSRIPYAGIYGACSTMALGLILSGIAVDSGAAGRAMCAASSHYCTAERQYRFPLEYGSQRPPTAQWTVTGAGACILEPDSERLGRHIHDAEYGRIRSVTANTGTGHDSENSQSLSGKKESGSMEASADAGRRIPNTDMPYLRAACIGVINDMAVTDQNNMGAAMAPAAADTIARFFAATNTDVYDYDAVFTGDLGRVGSRLLYDLMLEKGIDLAPRHKDCGVMIFSEDQDVHAGGSGCGCCASVLCGHILRNMCARRLRNILFIATGALLSPTTVLQKQTIPSVAHLVNIRMEDA